MLPNLGVPCSNHGRGAILFNRISLLVAAVVEVKTFDVIDHIGSCVPSDPMKWGKTDDLTWTTA